MKILAVDGGGTKTVLLLLDENLNILKHIRVGASNFIEKPEQVAKTLAAALSGLEADAVYAGMAGGYSFRDEIEEVFRGAGFDHIQIVSDLENSAQAELGEDDGCVIISGTGCACLAKRGGEYRRIGGWGYFMDIAGSGFSIGRDGLEAILRSMDGRGGQTAIKDIFMSCYQRTPEQMLGEIYNGGKSFIAATSPMVFEAAKCKDEIACEILHKNISALAEYIRTAAQFIGRNNFRVALTGGVVENQALARELLLELAPPGVEISLAELPQVCGAAIGARKMLGLDTTKTQRRKLLEEYHAAE